MNNALTNNAIGNLSVDETAKSGNGGSPRSNATDGSKKLPFSAAFSAAVAPPRSFASSKTSPVAPARLTYRIDPAVRQQVVDDFAGKLRSRGGANGSALLALFARQDPFAAFHHLTGSDGYRADNAADALAAYLVTGWMIAGGREARPDIEGTRIVRSRIAAAMLANPQRMSASSLQRLGDQLQLLTVVIAVGRKSAAQAGRMRLYADEVAGVFRSAGGIDLRDYDLTRQGFMARSRMPNAAAE